MKKLCPFLLALAVVMSGCIPLMTPPPKWDPVSDAAEAEYQPYLAGGSASLSGQAFLNQRGGDVVKAAGRIVTLDPATTAGTEWWNKAGTYWVHHKLLPPSPNFSRARRTTTADADGRFKFTGLAPGKYYVLTEVTWEVGGYEPTQGGVVGKLVEIPDGQAVEAIFNHQPE